MPENQERWNVWIDADLMRAVRVAAAVHGVSQKAITETALREYLINHPVDASEVTDTMTRATKPE